MLVLMMARQRANGATTRSSAIQHSHTPTDSGHSIAWEMATVAATTQSISNKTRMAAVFVYGSLLNQRVLRVLLGRVPRARPAALRAYHRFRIRERTYPAIATATDCTAASLDVSAIDARCDADRHCMGATAIATSTTVTGAVLSVSPAELAVLHAYECPRYEVRQVDVLVSVADANHEDEQTHESASASDAVRTVTSMASMQRVLHLSASTSTSTSMQCVSASTYVRPARELHDLYGTWCYEHHFVPSFDSYIAMCESFMHDYRRDSSLRADIAVPGAHS